MSGTMLAVPPMDATTLITCEYNPREWDGVATGLAWAILHDNPVMAWIVDATSAEPPKPVILGSLPPAPPETAPVVSPAWASFTKGELYVPDTWRGELVEFFDYVASNNGVQRPVYANFADDGLATEWNNWAARNPTLALKEPPNV